MWSCGSATARTDVPEVGMPGSLSSMTASTLAVIGHVVAVSLVQRT
jgi:hypothetical protein